MEIGVVGREGVVGIEVVGREGVMGIEWWLGERRWR